MAALRLQLFCDPLCRTSTWDCSVTLSSSVFKVESQSADYSQALCAEFLAQGCTHSIDCCADDDALFDYVENNVRPFSVLCRVPDVMHSCLSTRLRCLAMGFRSRVCRCQAARTIPLIRCELRRRCLVLTLKLHRWGRMLRSSCAKRAAAQSR